MNNMIKITKNILYRIFKKPSSYLVHLGLPIVVTVGIFMLFATGSSNVYRASVVDLSSSSSSMYILGEIEATGEFELDEIDKSLAEEYVAQERTSFVVIIPEDFEEKILAGEKPQLEIMSLKDSEGAAWIRSIMNIQIQNLVDVAYGAGYDKSAYDKIIANLNDTKNVSMNTELVSDISGELETTTQMLGMYLMLVMLSAGQIAFLILEEKRVGTFSRIGIAPVPARAYTISNVISNMLILSTQLIVVLLVLIYGVKINFHASIGHIFLALFTYQLCCVGIGILIASVTNKAMTAGGVMSLVLTPTCMIGGCFWPLEFMPKILRDLSHITPQRWALDAIALAQKGESMVSCLLVLGGMALLLFLCSAYIIKYKDKKI